MPLGTFAALLATVIAVAGLTVLAIEAAGWPVAAILPVTAAAAWLARRGV